MKESLIIKDALDMDDGILKVKHTSARMIGEVTINEVDPFGNVVFSSTEYNDLTIGGATFILEQMFKKASTNARFNLTLNSSNISSAPAWNTPDTATDPDIYIEDEKIFGFMIGIGGEDGVSIKAPSFTMQQLDEFIPFRMYPAVGSSTVEEDKRSLYAMPLSTTVNGTSYTGLYVKKFNDSATQSQSAAVDIVPEYTDGSGEVTSSNINTTDSPIYTYAKAIMEIDADDVREYFLAKDGILSNCRINQIGLVAGKYSGTNNGIDNYTDVKLVTMVNFKGRDLSNTENTLKLRYKIYCM